jgi:hypothetical protein
MQLTMTKGLSGADEGLAMLEEYGVNMRESDTYQFLKAVRARLAASESLLASDLPSLDAPSADAVVPEQELPQQQQPAQSDIQSAPTEPSPSL